MARKKMLEQEVRCEACGRIVYRYPSQQEHAAYHTAHPKGSGAQLGERGDAYGNSYK